MVFWQASGQIARLPGAHSSVAGAFRCSKTLRPAPQVASVPEPDGEAAPPDEAGGRGVGLLAEVPLAPWSGARAGGPGMLTTFKCAPGASNITSQANEAM